MELVIDASNIRAGGGLTHLVELLRNGKPVQSGFSKVYVWACTRTLDELDSKDWLVKKNHSLLDSHYLNRFIWKRKVLHEFLKRKKAILFIPGTGLSRFPYVTMCRNLLPLEFSELNRFFFSFAWLRLVLLSFIHRVSYSRAKGVIFLNQYCRDLVQRKLKIKDSTVIAHGLSMKFKKNQIRSNKCKNLIYVSTVNLYKHQWNIAEAIYILGLEGFDLKLNIVGTAYPKALRKLRKVMAKFEDKERVTYHGKVDYDKLNKFYEANDIFIFGSTCETFGMVILEAMGAGLPVLCSSKSSMPELVKENALYFDPENVDSIKAAILKLISNPNKIKEWSIKSIERAENFNWEKTSKKTFQYLAHISKLNISQS